MRPRNFALFLRCGVLFCWVSVFCHAQVDYEQPPINYSITTPGAMVALQARIASGELRFSGSEQDALKILLAALEVPVESQLLVF